ncbi:annulin [Halyomorpha halys]|uniref:annulin n=1 Tax=Halyomorpha halys TaxID=286706 RepID=UPI0006D4FF5C|nr:annulin [Halyomorpha halys]
MDWFRERVPSPCWSRHRTIRRQSSRRADLLPRPPDSYQPFDEVDLEKQEVLRIESVDPCVLRNGSEHNTGNFELMRRLDDPYLVVRRGQPFILKIKTSRAYAENDDAISFIFTLADADKPNYGQGTLIAVPLLSKGKNKDSWKATVDNVHENFLTVQISPSVDCVVGKYKMEIDSKLMKTGKAVSFKFKDPVYILFNPWCKDDTVFIEDEAKRKEYILTDTGLIWRGSHNVLQPSVWKYAQFEKDILDCSLYLVNKVGKVPYANTNNPVFIARALSAVVNSQDDNGVLVGNWSSEFDGGKKPTEWVGSMKILQKYFKTKKPVKYAQCWVFSGVLTTVNRALGIPSRPVTTYSSAHDTQNSLTVDYFVDDDGKVMDELQSDSIWNYHVWSEVWMKRDDLGREYKGWQVIDSTPQELSEGVFCCGPASVAAVKRGDVLRPYDAAFVYAEVNADKVYWRYAGPTQPLKLLSKETNGVGLNISTKAIGGWTREDITENYKYPEKTDDERASMLKALKQSESLFSRYYLNEEFNDVNFDFKLLDDIVIGSPFSVTLEMKNRNKTKEYSVSVILRVDTVLYTGKVDGSVKRDKFDVILKPATVEVVKMTVYYDEYFKKLVDQCAFNIACLATVKDTNFEYFAQDDFRVRKPDIKIKLDGEAVQDQPTHVTITLKNPLPIPIKKGEFHIEGPGLEKQLKIKVQSTIGSKEDAKADFKIIPPTSGKGVIVAKFSSKELDDVDGFINFQIREKNPANNGVTNNAIE